LLFDMPAKLHYAFRSPLGASLDGEAEAYRAPEELGAPPPGTRVAIIWLDDRTFRML
jgi:hypothetical protein